MKKENDALVINKTLVEVESDFISKHTEVSNIDTPKYYVKDKGGFDYVDEGYMRNQLNTFYPIWKWDIVKYEFLGDQVIVVHGRLTIVDNGVERHFDAVAAHRIAKNQKGYVDLGNDLKGANSDCFKVAVNRLCNVADDVYRKRIEDISLESKQLDEIDKKLNKIKDGKVVEKIKVGIESMTINKTNFDATMRKINKLIGD